MEHDGGQTVQKLDAEIPVRDSVHAVVGHIVEAQELGLQHPVRVVGGPRQGTGADGGDVHTLAAVPESSQVPQEHHGVGHQVVAEGDGLGPLHMGVARQDGVGIGFRLVRHRGDQGPDQGPNVVQLPPQVQPQIQRHLVVSASGGVELLPQGSQPLRQDLLHKHMDILAAFVKGKGPALNVRQHLSQAADEGLGLLLGENPLGP